MLSINIEVDTKSWGIRTVPIELTNLNGYLNFCIEDFLLCIGLVTKNPTTIGLSINDWWAYLRYKNNFEKTGNIRLVKRYEDVDSHQKTILSDDVGMGMTHLIMERSFGVKNICDTSFYLKYLKSFETMSNNKNGPNKSPDFIVLDNQCKIHIAESKGTQQSVAMSNKQIELGQPQKASIIDTNNVISEKLVIATYIAKTTGRKNSRVKITDPEFEYDFSKITKEEWIYQLMLSQIIKELSFILDEKLFDILPEEVIPQKIFDDSDYFEKFKRNILESEYMKRKIVKIEERNHIRLKQTFEVEMIKEKLNTAQNIKDFLDGFIERESVINKGKYKGIFGLEMEINLHDDFSRK